MLWPKKNSLNEFDNERNSCGSKIPLHPPPPHNFSNGPSLTESILWPIIDPILVTFSILGNFRDPSLVTFYLYIYPLIVNEEHFTFHLQYKHSGTFDNRKYEELSYPKNPKMCDHIIVSPP